MSNPDSFIDEVTEELRRDRLFRAMRRYGWIVILAVVVLVGATAFVEWRQAREQAAAEALGARIDAALNASDPAARVAALDAIAAGGDAGAVVATLASAQEAAAGKRGDAADRLAGIAANRDVSAPYRRMAALRQVMVAGDSLPAAEARQILEGIAGSGGAVAPLALEQLGLLAAREGDNETAVSRLREAMQSSAASAALRQRAAQLIIALGGSVTPA